MRRSTRSSSGRLRSYVEAMGGELHLMAKFPERPAVRLKASAKEEPAKIAPPGPRRQRERVTNVTAA
jgi:hypothetical protein